MSLESIPVKRPVPTSVGTFAGFGPAEERRRPLLIHPLQGDLQDQRRVLQEEGDGRQKVRQRGRERERERQGEKMFLNRSFQNLLGWTRFNRWSCKDTVDRLNPLFFFLNWKRSASAHCTQTFGLYPKLFRSYFVSDYVEVCLPDYLHTKN